MRKWSLLFLVLFVFTVFCQQEINQEDAQFASMKRSACLVLSRHHSNSHKEIISSVISQFNQKLQIKYFNKLYAVAVEICEPLITTSQVQEFYVENANFDPSSLFHILDTLDYVELSKNLNDPLTPNQQMITKFIKQFDDQLTIRQQQREAEKKKASGLNSEENQIKMFGFSFHKLSSFTKFLYAAAFFSLISVGLWMGFKKIDSKTEKKSSKKKKSPPKKE